MDGCTTHDPRYGGVHLKELKETWTVVPHMNQVCVAFYRGGGAHSRTSVYTTFVIKQTLYLQKVKGPKVTLGMLL